MLCVPSMDYDLKYVEKDWFILLHQKPLFYKHGLEWMKYVISWYFILFKDTKFSITHYNFENSEIKFCLHFLVISYITKLRLDVVIHWRQGNYLFSASLTL